MSGGLTLTILGCGTSSGVPRIGNDWGTCDPGEPCNRRTRASIVVQSATTCILVDTSPDMRQQLLDNDILHIDAVLWTHDHADHSHGIDDLRQIAHARRGPVPGYGDVHTLQSLISRFSYAFEGRAHYSPIIEAHVLPARPVQIGDIHIRQVAQPHGEIYSSGLRFECGGCSIGYATDFHDVTQDMIDLYRGVDIWVVDALRERPHPTHAHLAQTLDAIGAVRPGRAILTHMDSSMDYRRLCAMLPAHVEPGHDGMTVRLP